ncbi:hypothetical protein JYT79_01690 [Cardiobacterium sp. AH-315-I02]|nr:hypothetical protein [Cardiobacterium sp. AH-315-I02]
MPIIAADITFQLSGGGVNADPSAALGGAISSTAIVDAALHNLFDVVSGDESFSGDAEYRCLYVKNTHATLTYQNAKIWVETETTSADSDELIGLGSSAVNGLEQTVVDESTAPTGVAFTQSNLEAGALAIGDIPAGHHKAVWMRRDITAGAAAVNNDSSVLRVKGETAA